MKLRNSKNNVESNTQFQNYDINCQKQATQNKLQARTNNRKNKASTFTLKQI